MQRRKLVFFAGLDPDVSTRPAFMAYHFASVAHRSGLEAEVRLAGDAVEILKDGGVPDPGYNKRLLNYIRTYAVEDSR